MKTILRSLAAIAAVASFAGVASAANVTPMTDEWVYNASGEVAGSVQRVDPNGGADVLIGTPFRSPTFVTSIPADGFTLQDGHLTLR